MTEITRAAEDGSLREKLRLFVESRRFEKAIATVIALNAVILGLETSSQAMAAAGEILIIIDKIFLGIFVAELGTKMFVYRAGFHKNAWNVFDFIIVAISLIPSSGGLSVLRALRIFRALRLVSVVPSMRRVVESLLLIFYVFSVIATKLYAEAFPEWFGTIGASAYTLFQIMTLESWSMGVVRPVMELYPYSWALFVPFILVTSFAVLNLFVGVIVDASMSAHEEEREEERLASDGHAALMSELKALRQDVAELKRKA